MASMETCSSVDVLANSINDFGSGDFVMVNQNEQSQNGTTEPPRSLADSDLTSTEFNLVSRLKELAEENEGLRSVLNENNAILQNCFQELHNWQSEQKENHDKVIERHREAKEIILTLKKKNDKLKKDLDETRAKLRQQEDDNGASAADIEMMSKIRHLEEEKKELLQEKVFFEKNFGAIQSQIKEFINTNQEQPQLSMEDSVSMLKIVESLMESMNFQEANSESEQKSADDCLDGIPGVDHNMNCNMRAEIEKIKAEKSELIQKLEKLEEERATSRKETEELCTNLEAMSKELEKFKTESETFQKSVQILEEWKDEKADYEAKIAALEKQLQEYQEKEHKTSEIKELMDRKDKQISDFEEANAMLLESSRAFEEEVTELKKKYEVLEVTLKTKTIELKNAEENNSSLQECLTRLESKEQDELTQTQLLEELQNAVERQAIELDNAEDRAQRLEAENAELLGKLELEKERNVQMSMSKPESSESMPLPSHRLKEEKEELMQKLQMMRVHVQKVEERNNAYLNQLEVKQEKMKELEQELQKCEGQNQTLQKQVCSMYQDVVAKEKELDAMERRNSVLHDKSRKDAQRISTLEKEKDSLGNEFDELLKQREQHVMGEYKETLERMRKALEDNKIMDAELRQLKEKQSEDAAKLLSTEGLIERQEQELSNRAQAIAHLQQQLGDYRDDFTRCQEECQRAREDNRKLHDEIQILQHRIQLQSNSQMEDIVRRHAMPREQSGNTGQSMHSSSSSPSFHSNFPEAVSFEELPRRSRGVSNERMEDVFPVEGDIPEPCPVCGDRFLLMEELQNHIGGCLVANEIPRLSCPACDLDFPDVDTLQIHANACLGLE